MSGKFLAEIFAFLVILVVIYRYAVPPVRKAMRHRQEVIGAQFDEAREAKDEAEAAEAKYRASIRDAQAEADQLRQSAHAQGEQIAAELAAKAEEESGRIAERGRQQLAAERDSVVRELRTQMGTLAYELAQRIVVEALADRTRQAASIERFITELEGDPAEAGPAEAGPAAPGQAVPADARGTR